jgi:hypothetical protein
MNSDEARRSIHAALVDALDCHTPLEVKRAFAQKPWALELYKIIVREAGWFGGERPFYNVWPIAKELISSVKLDVPWNEVHFPFETMLFRFPVGHEPYGIASALIHDYSWILQDESRRGALAELQSQALDRHEYGGGAIEATIQFAAEPLVNKPLWAWNKVRDNTGADETVEQTLLRMEHDDPSPHVEFLYRLAVFTSLLARGQDLITPVVLAKDQQAYDAADPERRRWLEGRAARLQGRGFDLGRCLQEEKDSSPHWRNPHLCLFWTGPGRGRPLLKVRRGGVVIPKSLSDVPTGFLGVETPEELSVAEATYVRTPISARVRFEILRRDNYRCQLCGRAATDGVRLHIDHKVAAARGGDNSVGNLWTLCEPCNLGKSDLSLAPKVK